MIYMRLGDGTYMLVVEPSNVTQIKAGHPLITPDERFVICYTPDVLYVEQKIQEAQSKGPLTGSDLDEIIRGAAGRREVHR